MRKKALGRQELSFICVPILVNRKPAGALGADIKYKRTAITSEFLSIIATMIAQAIKLDHPRATLARLR